jgi:hypothetical protein
MHQTAKMNELLCRTRRRHKPLHVFEIYSVLDSPIGHEAAKD